MASPPDDRDRAEGRQLSGQGDRRPVPDPTALSTDLVHREIRKLREYLESRIDSVYSITQERFLRIENQLEQNDKLRVEMKADATRAVEAALRAQREAVELQTQASERAIAKSEAATMKQLDQISATFNTANESTRREIDDLKNGLTTVTAQKVGAKEDRTGLYAAVGAIGVLLGIVGVVAALLK